ncbi:MAG: ABC transporter ATP-binding protein [Mariprofundus sp.]|nr:ABC transporter ATP-binding protein [Mariprofundus sp.]
MSKPPLLSVANLHKHFISPSGDLQVLEGVSFELNEGEFLAIVGESGSGKSTMLQILGTLEQPDGGEVLIDGESIHGLGSNRQAHLRNEKIGFIYQAHHLIPELTALENITLPLLVQGIPTADAEIRGRELLVRLNLSMREQHVPAKLSGGEAQRVAVARALATKPRLLLADEPTGNLDEHTAQEVFELLRQLCHEENAAVVMVTHSMALARACDRILRLHDGQLLSGPC